MPTRIARGDDLLVGLEGVYRRDRRPLAATDRQRAAEDLALYAMRGGATIAQSNHFNVRSNPSPVVTRGRQLGNLLIHPDIGLDDASFAHLVNGVSRTPRSVAAFGQTIGTQVQRQREGRRPSVHDIRQAAGITFITEETPVIDRDVLRALNEATAMPRRRTPVQDHVRARARQNVAGDELPDAITPEDLEEVQPPPPDAGTIRSRVRVATEEALRTTWPTLVDEVTPIAVQGTTVRATVRFTDDSRLQDVRQFELSDGGWPTVYEDWHQQEFVQIDEVGDAVTPDPETMAGRAVEGLPVDDRTTVEVEGATLTIRDRPLVMQFNAATGDSTRRRMTRSEMRHFRDAMAEAGADAVEVRGQHWRAPGRHVVPGQIIMRGIAPVRAGDLLTLVRDGEQVRVVVTDMATEMPSGPTTLTVEARPDIQDLPENVVRVEDHRAFTVDGITSGEVRLDLPTVESVTARFNPPALVGLPDAQPDLPLLPAERPRGQARTIPVAEVHDVNVRYQPSPELQESIQDLGVIQPIAVVRRRGGGGYRVAAGRRRVNACRNLGITEVPALVFPVGTPLRVAASMALAENQHREPNPIDDLHQIEELARNGFVLEQIAADLNIPMNTLRRRMRLASLIPELQEALSERRIALTVAERAALLPVEQQQVALAVLRQTDRLSMNDLRGLEAVEDRIRPSRQTSLDIVDEAVVQAAPVATREAVLADMTRGTPLDARSLEAILVGLRHPRAAVRAHVAVDEDSGDAVESVEFDVHYQGPNRPYADTLAVPEANLLRFAQAVESVGVSLGSLTQHLAAGRMITIDPSRPLRQRVRVGGAQPQGTVVPVALHRAIERLTEHHRVNILELLQRLEQARSAIVLPRRGMVDREPLSAERNPYVERLNQDHGINLVALLGRLDRGEQVILTPGRTGTPTQVTAVRPAPPASAPAVPEYRRGAGWDGVRALLAEALDQFPAAPDDESETAYHELEAAMERVLALGAGR